MSDIDYSEPFRLIGETPPLRPQFATYDRVQGALRGYLDETLLSEDEWDRFAALREQTSPRPCNWRLLIAGADSSCLSSRATRRLHAVLEYAESVLQVIVHTVNGPIRVRRQFKDSLSRTVHFFIAEHIGATAPTGESIDEWVERHLAAFFRISPKVLAVEFPKTGSTAGRTITNVCAFAQGPDSWGRVR